MKALCAFILAFALSSWTWSTVAAQPPQPIIFIEQGSYTAIEGTELEVCVIVDAGDLTQDVTVDLELPLNSLNIPLSLSLELTLSPTNLRECGTFPFPDDSVNSGSTVLTITMSLLDSEAGAVLGRDMASVLLLDDNGMPTVMCPPLDDPDQGSVSLSGLIVGSMATYTCDPTYQLVGNPTRVCEDVGGVGVWSGEAPICEAIVVAVEVGFERMSYLVMEGSNTEVCLIISAGIVFERFFVSIHFIHPIYGREYYFVFFNPGMRFGNTSCVNIGIEDDDVFNGNQTVNLELEVPDNATNRVSLGRNNATLFVIDNDDINFDECFLGLDNCDSNAICTDTIGGFNCTCRDGFTGNGVICTPVRIVELRFSPERFSVVEGRAVDVCIFATNLVDRDIQVMGQIVIPSLDIACDFSFMIPASSSTKHTKSIRIPDDNILNEEAQRSLDAYLRSNSSSAMIPEEGERAEIIVIDNEIVTVGFEDSQYTFFEDEGPAHICVQLMQGSRCQRPVVVRVHSQELPALPMGPNRAEEEEDFEPLWEIVSVNINAEQGDLFCFYVNLIDDEEIEYPEVFNVNLEIFDINAYVPFDSRLAVVTILDDDNITAMCPPLEINNGSVTVTGLTEGSLANYSCDPFFSLDGNETRICGEDGLWSGEDPECVPDPMCPPLMIRNGSVTVTGFTEGSVANYSCDPFFTLSGMATRTCGDDGLWSGEDPVCERDPISVDCIYNLLGLGGPVNVSCTAEGPYPIETIICDYDNGTIVEECDFPLIINFDRFEPGNHYLEIIFTDTDGEEESFFIHFVVPAMCPPLSVNNGTVVISGFLPGSTANYSCDPFYTLNGPEVRVCGNDGEWSGDEPECERDPISLDCSSQQTSPSGPFNTGCMATGPFPIVSVECNLDNGTRVEDCPGGVISIMFGDLEPGTHVLVITFTDSDGVTAIQVFTFTVPPRLNLSCVLVRSNPYSFTFFCTAENSLFLPLACSVSDGDQNGLLTECSIDKEFTVEIPPLMANTNYTLSVTAIDVFEQTESVELFFTTGEPPQLVIQFNDDTPEVNGSEVRVSFTSNRPLSSAVCNITSSRQSRNCIVSGNGGSFTYVGVTGVRERDLIIEAFSTDGQQAALVRGIRSEATGQCSAHLINEGVIVNTDNNTVDFQISIIGPSPSNRVTEASCRLDGGPTEPCPDPLQFPAGMPGPHRLEVRPIDTPDNICIREQPLFVDYTV